MVRRRPERARVCAWVGAAAVFTLAGIAAVAGTLTGHADTCVGSLCVSSTPLPSPLSLTTTTTTTTTDVSLLSGTSTPTAPSLTSNLPQGCTPTVLQTCPSPGPVPTPPPSNAPVCPPVCVPPAPCTSLLPCPSPSPTPGPTPTPGQTNTTTTSTQTGGGAGGTANGGRPSTGLFAAPGGGADLTSSSSSSAPGTLDLRAVPVVQPLDGVPGLSFAHSNVIIPVFLVLDVVAVAGLAVVVRRRWTGVAAG